MLSPVDVLRLLRAVLFGLVMTPTDFWFIGSGVLAAPRRMMDVVVITCSKTINR